MPITPAKAVGTGGGNLKRVNTAPRNIPVANDFKISAISIFKFL